MGPKARNPRVPRRPILNTQGIGITHHPIDHFDIANLKKSLRMTEETEQEGMLAKSCGATGSGGSPARTPKESFDEKNVDQRHATRGIAGRAGRWTKTL
jgi:hypothetical protein